MSFDVVVPTVGRDSLLRLLEALAVGSMPVPGRVLLVDDRRDRSRPLPVSGFQVEVLGGRAAGPAAARNLGWRRAGAGWVAFLDDDVVPGPTWAADLLADLAGLPPEVAATQGRVVVPMPAGRRPTDWERNVRGLETARWATADMAYRRRVLAEVGGFDERFPRAYREDADLGLRVVAAGYRIVRGRRSVTHPVRPAGRLISLRLQAGNADDVLMLALHGPGWRDRAGVPAGRRPRHLVVTGLGLVALGVGLSARRGAPRGGRRARLVGLLAGAGWLAGTAELALARVLPGPRTPAEVATMAITSALLPPAATWHWLTGWRRLPRRLADTARAPHPTPDPPAAPSPSHPLPNSPGPQHGGAPAAPPPPVDTKRAAPRRVRPKPSCKINYERGGGGSVVGKASLLSPVGPIEEAATSRSRPSSKITVTKGASGSHAGKPSTRTGSLGDRIGAEGLSVRPDRTGSRSVGANGCATGARGGTDAGCVCLSSAMKRDPAASVAPASPQLAT